MKSDSRPTVVQFGAGCIGRGFLGPIWTAAGYEVVYVDIKPGLVEALDARRSYPLRLTDGTRTEEHRIAPGRALHRRDFEAVTEALSRCAFAATAVGVANLPEIAPAVASGILRRAELRSEVDDPTLRVLCCENGISAADDLRRAVERSSAKVRGLPEEAFASVPTSVGRMVPQPTPELLAEDELLLLAEPCGELYIRGALWHGLTLADAPGVHITPFCEEYAVRKLYTHNGGHAALAYLGQRRGYTHIWEAAEDAELAGELRAFWNEAGTALRCAYDYFSDFEASEQRAYEEELLHRFRNRALGDTIGRVGRDPARKLRPEERLIGPALLCLEEGIEPLHIARVIAAALRFAGAGDDPSAAPVRETAREKGVAAALWKFSRIPASSSLVPLVRDAYNDME